jgi:S1-C subfamily serine protease
MIERFWFSASLASKVPVLALLALIFAGPTVAQEQAHQQIRESLVYLEASGIGIEGVEAGVNKASKGTGFLVSKDGLILTTYHLLSGLGKVAPESVIIRANIGKKAEQLEYKAAPVNAVPELDLLLLKIPPGLQAHKPVKLGTLNEAESATNVNTSGFPESANYRPASGSIGSKDTDTGYLWEVNNMAFDFGQSGSPVYTNDGTVIGIAKGQLKNSPTVNYIIPIQFADSLLASLRMSEMQQQIATLNSRLAEIETKKVDPAVKNIDEIASNFEWSATVSGDDILVTYEKLANTGPQIDTMTVSATPIARGKTGPLNMFATFVDSDKDSEPDFTNPDEFDSTKRRSVAAVKLLFFEVKKAFCVAGSAVEMTRIKIDIVPFLKGGTQLEPESIFLEHSLDKRTDCNANS